MIETGVSRPKLLVLTSTLPRWAGDSEPRFVLDLARALRDCFDPLILAPMAVGAARREILEGVPVERFSYAPLRWQTLAAPGAIMPNLRRRPLLYALVPFFLLAQFIALVRLLRRERFDVIHCHWLVPQGLVLALAGLFVRVPPTLLTCHGADAFTLEQQPLRQLKRLLLRRADAVTVVSREIGAHLGAATKQPPHHVPMGVDLEGFTERCHVPGAQPTLLFIGRLAAKKGLDRLVRVMADPAIAARGALLRVVGDGPLRPDLEALVATLGLGERVIFLGALPHAEVARHMREADIFCAPFVIGDDGDREGTPTVLLEAAASAIPVITTNVGGCGDIIRDGESGWLLPPGDERALAGAILEALDDPARARTMAARARQAVLDFSWPKIAGRYGEILAQIGQSRRQAA